jgi:hypothetical protein
VFHLSQIFIQPSEHLFGAFILWYYVTPVIDKKPFVFLSSSKQLEEGRLCRFIGKEKGVFQGFPEIK